MKTIKIENHYEIIVNESELRTIVAALVYKCNSFKDEYKFNPPVANSIKNNLLKLVTK